ncbi:MAG: NAD-dependent epimerase/dehydratase family protein [Planctomycetota bacterium]|nr:NAD-dependent epimerase/dehydratase family protein [Planctomycetota bacterium]
MARVLVTGGAGFIGSHVCQALLARGDDVTIVDSFDPFYEESVKRGNLAEVAGAGDCRLVEADIRDRDRMTSLFAEGQFEAVVHLAAKAGVRPSIEDPAGYVSTNLDGSTVLFDLAVVHEIPRFVFASSSSVYGNNEKVPFCEDDPVDHPVSPYAATKKAGELVAHTYHHVHGLNVACLRFFTVYGPRQRPEMAIHKFTRLIDAGDPVPFFGDGTSRRDYTYVDDIVDGVLRSLDRCEGYRIYNLGESHTTTLARLVELIEAALGKKAVLDRQPFQRGDVQETFANISRAQTELGYDPSTLVEEGIPKFVAWFRSRTQ